MRSAHDPVRSPRAGPPPDLVPPRFTDPRRIGAVAGLVGAFVFVQSYATELGPVTSAVATYGGYLIIAAALLRLFGRPRWLGTFRVPRTVAILGYLGCVVAELVLIRLGSGWLASAGHAEARPALIAGVVGLHFIPFAWAFGERMFFWLGGSLVALGAGGLVAGLAGSTLAPASAAVASGWVIGALVLAYGWGVFARPRHRPAG